MDSQTAVFCIYKPNERKASSESKQTGNATVAMVRNLFLSAEYLPEVDR